MKIATLGEPVAPVTVGASWPIGTFTTPVTVQMTPKPQLASAPTTGGTSANGSSTPSPIAGGFSIGNTVFQLTVTNMSTGAAVTSFSAPIVFHVSALATGDVPAYSHDGTTWTTIPRLDSPELPATQPDGYYVNPDGSARHLHPSRDVLRPPAGYAGSVDAQAEDPDPEARPAVLADRRSRQHRCRRLCDQPRTVAATRRRRRRA